MILAAEVALAQTGEPRYLDAAERAYGWFLGDNDVGLADGRSGDGRLLRRPRAGQREPQPGRRVDAHVADRARARPRDPPRCGERDRRWPRTTAATRPRQRDRPRAEGDDHGRRRRRPLHAPSAQPDHHGRPAAVPRQLRVQPRRRAGRRRDACCWCASRTCGASRICVVGAERGRRDGLAVRRRAAARARNRSTTRRRSGAARIPRLTWLPEREEWAIAYTAYSRRGPLVSLAMTRDFTRGPPARPGDAARGQGRGAVPAPVRRPLGDDPPTVAARAAARTCGSRTRPTSGTGATTACCSRRATAPGGTPARSASGRRRSRPPTAGCSATTAST